MQNWWKNPRIVGNAAYYVMHLLRATLRVKVKISPLVDPNTPYLVAFWHGKQFLPAVMLNKHHNTPRCAMVSPSRDGAMLAVFLEKSGYQVIRGSSRDSGTRALMATKERLEGGSSIGFAIDGPIGPIHVIKPGITFLAQKCNTKIIPIGVAYKKFWIFHKAWDKFQLPKPFTKAVLIMGAPFSVKADEDLKDACLFLEKRMQEVQREANELLGIRQQSN